MTGLIRTAMGPMTSIKMVTEHPTLFLAEQTVMTPIQPFTLAQWTPGTTASIQTALAIQTMTKMVMVLTQINTVAMTVMIQISL